MYPTLPKFILRHGSLSISPFTWDTESTGMLVPGFGMNELCITWHSMDKYRPS